VYKIKQFFIYDYNLFSVSSSVHDFWIFSRRSVFLVVDPDVFKKKAIGGTFTKLLQKNILILNVEVSVKLLLYRFVVDQGLLSLPG
tara:strand:- start:1025 stop:1282 length:258 start_codon:yes stop_codon:yes gene_type:complete